MIIRFGIFIVAMISWMGQALAHAGDHSYTSSYAILSHIIESPFHFAGLALILLLCLGAVVKLSQKYRS